MPLAPSVSTSWEDSSQQLCQVDSPLSALPGSKCKFREVKTLSQGHTATSSSTAVSVLLAMHKL